MLLEIDTHCMTVRRAASLPTDRPLESVRVSSEWTAWADAGTVSGDRVVEIRGHRFGGAVYLTGALGGAPNYGDVPPLRFFSGVSEHLATLLLDGCGAPTFACDCTDRCGVCREAFE